MGRLKVKGQNEIYHLLTKKKNEDILTDKTDFKRFKDRFT